MRTRLLTGLIALSLALVTTPAVMAQEEETSPEAATTEQRSDCRGIPSAVGRNTCRLILYLELREAILASGVAAEEIPATMDDLEAEVANLSQAEVDELLAALALAASDAEGGDDEFGQAEEDEPELGDGEDDDEGGDSDG